MKKVFQKKKKPSSLSLRITFTVAFIIFMLYSLSILFFFLFALILATKESQSVFLDDFLLKKLFSFSKPNFRNFIDAFKEWETIQYGVTYLDMTWNSTWMSVGGTTITTMSTAMVCYILVYYRNGFTKFLYKLGLFLTILPIYGSTAPMYRLYDQIGFVNNPFNMITGITLYGGYFFYMYAFYKAISWEYAEAAFIDGAGHYTVFFRIIFPMVVPSMMALYVMSFIGNWNGYESILLYMREYPNLSYGIYAYGEISAYNANTPAYFAGVIIALLPALILFLFFQNSIMEKVYMGGLKG